MASQQTVKIDDRDPSITYSNGWSQGGAGTEYMNTVTLTVRVKASAMIPFTGTKIMAYGTIPSTAWGQAPVSLFSIDGGPSTQFVQNQIDTSSQYQQQFYASPDLPQGKHVLMIAISSVPNATASFELDFFEYFTSVDASSTLAGASTVTVTGQIQSSTQSVSSSSQTSVSVSNSVTTASSNSTQRPSGVSTIAFIRTGSSAPTPSSSITGGQGNSNTSSQSPQGTGSVSKSSTPVILGAIVGILALILLILGVFLFLKKRKSRQTAIASDQSNNLTPPRAPMRMKPSTLNTSVTPFLTVESDPRTSDLPPAGYLGQPSPGTNPLSKPSAVASTSFDVFSPQTHPGSSKATEARGDGRENEYDYPPPCYES